MGEKRQFIVTYYKTQNKHIGWGGGGGGVNIFMIYNYIEGMNDHLSHCFRRQILSNLHLITNS